MNTLNTLLVSTVALVWMPLALAQAPVEQHADAGDAAIERASTHDTRDGERDALERRACVRETGSRIRRLERDERCLSGRSYDREDIRRTGEVDVGRALRKLDPSIY